MIAPWEDPSLPSPTESAGSLVSLRFSDCISAGLSLGQWLPFDSASFDGPMLKDPPAVSVKHHERLVHSVPLCDNLKKQQKQMSNADSATQMLPVSQCLSFLKLNPSALRARTPTSAGMLNVLWEWNATTTSHLEPKERFQKNIDRNLLHSNPLYKKYKKGATLQHKYQGKLWEAVGDYFGASTESIVALRSYLARNMGEIARDNLLGQCSSGHSCKNSSASILKEIVDDAGLDLV